MNTRNILITGANGYIGSHLCAQLGQQHHIHPISLRQTPKPDLTGVDTLIHLSALVHGKGEQSEDAHQRINTEQTLTLAKTAKEAGVKQFIFFSTMAVYGGHGSLDSDSPLTEQSPCQPTSAYGRSKLQAELQLKTLMDDHFKVAIIRPPMVYGKHCPGNMARLAKLASLSPILPFGNQTNRRSIVSIENLVRFTQQITEQQVSGIFLPQDPEPQTIKQMAAGLAQAKQKKCLFIPLPLWLLKTLEKISPRIVQSLYGSLYYDNADSLKRLHSKSTAFSSSAQGYKRMLDQDQ